MPLSIGSLVPGGVLAAAGMLAVGCTEPQSGNHAAAWCHAADQVGSMVDDMEDHDGKLCPSWPGAWQVALANPGGATTTPPAGALAMTDDLPTAMLPAGRQASSTRGLHFAGAGFTSSSIASAVLGAELTAPASLASYSSIKLWAATDAEIWIRVNVAVGTELATASRWGSAVRLAAGWGEVTVPLAGLTQESGAAAAAPDLSSVVGVEIEYAYFIKDAGGANPAAGSFDVWIDDLELTP